MPPHNVMSMSAMSMVLGVFPPILPPTHGMFIPLTQYTAHVPSVVFRVGRIPCDCMSIAGWGTLNLSVRGRQICFWTAPIAFALYRWTYIPQEFLIPMDLVF